MHFIHVLLLGVFLSQVLFGYGLYTAELKGSSVRVILEKRKDNGSYLLDYRPGIGTPSPNTTFHGQPSIEVSHLLPATRYHFSLYLTNATQNHYLVFNALIDTEPDPPRNLSVISQNSTSALLHFSPPASNWTSFKLMIINLNENKSKNITLRNIDNYCLFDLIPGCTYQIKLFTLFRRVESSKFLENEFTTQPYPPSKLIAWNRTETSLSILVNLPSSNTIYSLISITITSKNTTSDEQIIKIGGSPQAVFKGLVPGKLYSVCTGAVSNGVESAKICEQYRTLPLPPTQFKVVTGTVSTSSFSVSWNPPLAFSEFDKYLISIDLHKQNPVSPIIRKKSEIRVVRFTEDLFPGRTYQVNATTVSGNVRSKPIIVNATLRPLRVKRLSTFFNENGQAEVLWIPNNTSYQDSFEVCYAEVFNNTIYNGDSNSLLTTKYFEVLESLLPGRNYSVSVKSVSNNLTSSPMISFIATRPSIPNIEELKLIEYGFNISWKAEVDSRQDHYQIFVSHNLTLDDNPDIITTNKTNYVIKNLYPGALYYIEILAISHGMRSLPHNLTQAVMPKPPLNLIKKVWKNSLRLSWEGPRDSLYTEYSVRSKTEDEKKWNNHTVLDNFFSLKKLISGERYFIQISTVSYGVESHPLHLSHSLNPQPISYTRSRAASTNISLEFLRPEGRIDFYVINYMTVDENEQTNQTLKKINGTGMKGEPVSVVIENLMPGATYLFIIYTMSYDLQSVTTNITAQTIPVIESELKVLTRGVENNSLIVEYTPTVSSHFDRYRFRLSSPGLVQEKNRTDKDRKVTFLNLVPGQLYNITTWTISRSLLSSPIFKMERLCPSPVSHINVTNITNCSVTLSWHRPEGEVNAYEIKIFNASGLVHRNITIGAEYCVNNLRPHMNYTIEIVVRAGNETSLLRRSIPYSTLFQTNEGLPGMVRDFQVVDVRPRQITFDWKLQLNETNGVLTKFRITCNREESSDLRTVDVKPTERRIILKDLTPGGEYLFKIRAATRIGYGPEASIKKTLPILAPPKPGSQAIPSELSRTSTTIRIKFQKDYFSDENGQVLAYTIIVAEDDKKNTSEIELRSWGKVQSYPLWPPYQVMEPYNPFNSSTVEEYTIGADTSCQANKSEYCNGPLKQGAVYRIKVRAFTTEKDFTETDYSLPIQTDQNQLALCVAFLLPGLFLVTLVFGNVLIKKIRNRHENDTNIYQLRVPIRPIITSKPIKTDRFADYYQSMSSDMNLRFSEEFEKLQSVGVGQACTVGKEQCNRTKNRFINILPFDHNRFKLQPIDYLDGSDYINASYISGYNSMKEYIATQGPLRGTKDDFWRMCWESNTRAIVMLTRCLEEGRDKCARYWPEDTESIYYGNICVNILNQKFHPDWCVTELNVRKGATERTIRHFHFTSWPVFGVPKLPSLLVKFVKMFREKVLNEHRPIIVHCCAGVGRSGTFIAVDHILQIIEHGDETMDVYGIVYQMRKERMLMVQTEQQYVTIHKCVLAILNDKRNPIPNQDQIYDNITFEDDEGIAETGM